MWIELNTKVTKVGLKRIAEDPKPHQAPTLPPARATWAVTLATTPSPHPSPLPLRCHWSRPPGWQRLGPLVVWWRELAPREGS